ncbi:hypothetical protein [Rhizobium leguminosarum]|uniref:Putative integral membrane protein n=1 Tax=Rhizobium leguminosarum TaxID=384 RepID=A0A2Z4YU47_RHILE|nr:hypothetical protein [Rhizobium leguminosarum]AXA44619.1 putative integral membrane protein [Rhizobium leguminosarum]
MLSLTSSIYLWCLVGIVISTILPVLWQYVRIQFPSPRGLPDQPLAGLPEFLLAMKPYLALCLASALTAILLVAFLGDNLTDARAAILAGYAWDSTLQKLR